MQKIWQKNNKSTGASNLFNNFTTGNDWEIDRDHFLHYDLLASIAHASSLQLAGIYTTEEFNKIRLLLSSAINNPELIEVTQETEDCHTAIEIYLTKKAGDLGKKIHTGRSRNDQSLTMIRLYMKSNMYELRSSLTTLISDFNNKSIDHKDQIFIGYSHTQQAMLTTLGHYYNSFKEQFIDDRELLSYIYSHIDKNPLGSAAGFGSPIYLDRNHGSELMGFASVQNNSLYCQNSRGKFELLYLHGLSQVMQTLQRFATDIILYTTREFSFFDIDDELSQGSSMMPQKKNLDVFEIIRAKSAEVMSLENRVQLMIKGLPSGYNRDLQLIKNALVEATDTVKKCIEVFDSSLRHIRVNNKNIRTAIKKDIYSADVAILKCIQDNSLNFRDVYKSVLDSNMDLKPEDIINSRASRGGPGNYL